MERKKQNASKRKNKKVINIAKTSIQPGEMKSINLPVANLPNHVMLDLPVVVLNGLHAGPVLWVSAAVHGDEVNGVLMIRDIVNRIDVNTLSGTIIAVPVVNVFGFIHQSRYLPDRRDLNRSFPGSKRGSLASRMANIFMKEIISQSDFGIDIHTGSHNRTNAPQIRVDKRDNNAVKLAKAFSAPILIYKSPENGSLRKTAEELGVPNIIFEGGEANRFDRDIIKSGTSGILRVLKHLKMIKNLKVSNLDKKRITITCENSVWIRAKQSGILKVMVSGGQSVKKGDVLAHISDVYGENRNDIYAPLSGIVIGQSVNTIVYQGDAVIHIGLLA